ncbi:MAG TPA: HK97 family phage prohead protease [Actinomycetota bacterium]|nr:HK97 family phage prohead protease [Actinomycetota bacterium]
METTEFKRFPLSEFKASADVPGQFEAIVSVFGNVDRIGDRVIKGAFERTLKDRGLPPVYHSHDWYSGPIGASLDAEEREEGLWIKGQLFVDLEDPFVKRIWQGMKTTGPREFSFAYQVVESRWVTEDEKEIREIVDVELFEVGPTLVGMNPDTQLLQVASALKPGRLHAGKDHEFVQRAHDTLVEEGAECASGEDATDAGNAVGDSPDIIAKRARITEVLSMTRYKEVS